MEEELKKIMGEAYKENMTSDEIQNFFKDRILGAGTYVRKEMVDAESRRLKEELEKKNEELKNKMTEEEKKALADEETQKRIKELEQKLLQSTIDNNEAKVFGITAKARNASGIKDDDKEFAGFIKTIINDNEDNSLKIANYINNLVEKAYEKGKSDITKNKLGDMGNFRTGNGTDSNNLNTMAEKAKKLAQENNITVKNSYFK